MTQDSTFYQFKVLEYRLDSGLDEPNFEVGEAVI